MRVFKYRGGTQQIFERDLNSLKEDFFWAPTRDCLNDPCEGLYNKKPLDNQLDLIFSLLSNSDPIVESSFKDLKAALERVLDFVNKAGIYSLSKSPHEELLWAHYAYSHTGFCIEYDLEKLIDFEKK